eukprot:gnl/TRDRNA2_/TRDRNA2_169819_c10_seq1.p1 gnl/TRDRNA2_/TRDRNA2_169819_c10~~gnl/TRDRNA2_/TRDRNA2_169819_c10_seq1.p1  ORF type:complete len:261 (-),score=50.11 gnl/TRDRNA2_/TRDRNA2_169819_c10_seq1:146-871(-)
MTDHKAEVLKLMQENIDDNELGATVFACHLDWADKSTYLDPGTFDMVVAADVLYDGYGGPKLAMALDAHVAAGSECFFAFMRRSEAPLSVFATLLAMGFTLERLEDAEGRAVGDINGEAATIYADSRFVELPVEGVVEAVKGARFCRSTSIQIFRLSRSRSALRRQIWVVVDDIAGGGPLVRSGKELTSPALSRLSNGARIEEVELLENRMCFQKLSGDGPSGGWVSIAFKGRAMLTREPG